MSTKLPTVNFNKDQIKETVLNFLVPLICLVLSLGLGFFVIYPSYNSLPELQATLNSQKDLEAKLDKKVVSLNRLIDFKKIVDENVLLVSKALASEAMVPELLTQIDQIAKESGLNVEKLSYSLTESDSGPATKSKTANASPVSDTAEGLVLVNLGVSGNFNQLKAFLHSLEEAARLVNVSSVRFSVNDKEKSRLDVALVLESPFLFVQSDAVTDSPINLDITNRGFVALINKVKQLKYYPVSIDKDVVSSAEETPQSTASTRKP